MRMAMRLRTRDARQFKQQDSRVLILIEQLMVRFIGRIKAFSGVSARRNNAYPYRQQPEKGDRAKSHATILDQ